MAQDRILFIRSFVESARAIGTQSPRPQSKEVYRQLLSSAAPGRRPKARSHDEVVKDAEGRPQFRIRQLRNCIALLLPVERVSAKTLANIREKLPGILATPASAESSVRATSTVALKRAGTG